MSDKRNIAIVLNPAAKGEKAARLVEEVRRETDTRLFRLTEAAGDAEIIARDFVKEGADTIIAAGGDGTINEVVNGIADSDVPLGILPIGTANVLAKELGIPSDWRKAWKVILDGVHRKVDLGRAGEHYFVQMAGVGFDAQIIRRTDWEFKKNWGPMSYIITGVGLMTEKSPRLCVESDELGDETLEGGFVLVGNGRYYGGPFEVFHGAKIDDGQLDVYVFEKMEVMDVMGYLQDLLTGTHHKNERVIVRKLKQFTVKAQGGDVPAEADGELLGKVPVTFQVVPHALDVLVPERLSPSFSDYKESEDDSEDHPSNYPDLLNWFTL